MNSRELNQELFNFIKSSPSPFHAVASAAALLEADGFSRLQEQDTWNLLPGGKYYVTRNQSSIAAFRIPKKTEEGLPPFHIIASHSDSPSFKLKENGEMTVEDHYTRLNMEQYGGPIFSSWFDRPLSLAGRALVEENGTIESRLVDFDRDLAMLVNLAIHMNRNINDGYKYSVQTDMMPLIGGGDKDFSMKKLVARQLNIPEESILTMDLFLYNRMAGCTWGAEEEFISCPRLDDLQCAFSSVKAITGSCRQDILPVAVIFDNEEVGSQSRQGAHSTFLKDVLERIRIALSCSREELLRALAESFMVSADNGHALHPNYPGKSNPGQHPYLNGGVMVKYSANQKYTSDGVSSAIFRAICSRENIPCQLFFNHSDVLGGSTLGNLSASQVSLACVDIGAPLLAMHSPCETTGAQDTLALTRSMSAFYQTRIRTLGDGSFRLLGPQE